MFSNLFFLIVILMIINFAPEVQTGMVDSIPWAFAYGMTTFIGFIALLLLQNIYLKPKRKKQVARMLLLVNSEFILWLSTFIFYFGAHRAIPGGSQFILSLIFLFLYFLSIAFFHYTVSARPLRRIEVSRQIRMILPFLVPYLIFSLLIDITLSFENPLQTILLGNGNTLTDEIILLTISLLFLGSSMIFLPFFIQKIWKCSPLSNKGLLIRLEEFCHRADFKHAGMLTWTVMNPHHTAAIVGVVPRFRYVMFTQNLLNFLDEDQVEAVLAHEIGHSKHHHMIKYPLIILGMLCCAGLFSLFFSQAINSYTNLHALITPSPIWVIAKPLLTLIPYILIIGLYFRFIFGYFSRLFERQADLYPIELGIPPSHVIGALDQIAEAAGGIHKQPSWHHFSIQQRIDFLESTIEHPDLIAKHHRKSWVSLDFFYGVLILFLTILASPILSDFPMFDTISRRIERTSNHIDNALNKRLRRNIAEDTRETHKLIGSPEIIEKAMEKGLFLPGGNRIPGVFELYAAEKLLKKDESTAALQLLVVAWEKFDFTVAPESAYEEFLKITNQAIEKAPKTDKNSALIKKLQKEKLNAQ